MLSGSSDQLAARTVIDSGDVYDGTAKPTVYARWMAARATPWRP